MNTKHELLMRLVALIKSDAIDHDRDTQAEFDRVERELIESIGEWRYSLALDRLLADVFQS